MNRVGQSLKRDKLENINNTCAEGKKGAGNYYPELCFVRGIDLKKPCHKHYDAGKKHGILVKSLYPEIGTYNILPDVFFYSDSMLPIQSLWKVYFVYRTMFHDKRNTSGNILLRSLFLDTGFLPVCHAFYRHHNAYDRGSKVYSLTKHSSG